MYRTLLILLAIGLILSMLAVASCTGGSTAAPDNSNVVKMTGKLSLDGTVHGASAVDGLLGVTITALELTSGSVLGTQITQSDGSFQFNNLTKGPVMLRIDPGSSVLLNGISSSDPLVLMQELDLSGAAQVQYTGLLTLVDRDGDGMADSMLVQRELRFDGTQRLDEDLRELRPELQEVLIDSNRDGETTDETPLEDVDNDGIPDDATGNINSLHGGVLRGAVEAINADSLTVLGVDFTITDATRWKDKGNGQADPSLFVSGFNVLIKGLWNGESWIALEVKATGPRVEPPETDSNPPGWVHRLN